MKTLIVTARQRALFKRPQGKVYPGKSAVAPLRKVGCVVSVGDISTRTLLEAGIAPALAIADNRCKRKPVGAKTQAAITAWKAEGIHVKNPAGTISAALQTAVRRVFAQKLFPSKIIVDGEEDLAVIPAAAFAPLGAAVYYGQPNAGGVVITVNAAKRRRFRRIMGLAD